MSTEAVTSENPLHGPDEEDHYGAHHPAEWQPWDFGSRAVLTLAILAIAGLIAVFVSLTLHH